MYNLHVVWLSFKLNLMFILPSEFCWPLCRSLISASRSSFSYFPSSLNLIHLPPRSSSPSHRLRKTFFFPTYLKSYKSTLSSKRRRNMPDKMAVITDSSVSLRILSLWIPQSSQGDRTPTSNRRQWCRLDGQDSFTLKASLSSSRACTTLPPLLRVVGMRLPWGLLRNRFLL